MDNYQFDEIRRLLTSIIIELEKQTELLQQAVEVDINEERAEGSD